MVPRSQQVQKRWLWRQQLKQLQFEFVFLQPLQQHLIFELQLQQQFLLFEQFEQFKFLQLQLQQQ